MEKLKGRLSFSHAPNNWLHARKSVCGCVFTRQGSGASLPQVSPLPALAQQHRSRHNFNRARGSGLGPRRLAPRECAARRSFNSGSRPPAAPGPARRRGRPGAWGASRPAGTRSSRPSSRSTARGLTSEQAGEAAPLTCPPSAAPKSPPSRQRSTRPRTPPGATSSSSTGLRRSSLS